MTHLRTPLPTLATFLLVACFGTFPVMAQDWIKEMFTENSHDFGTVPRGAKTEFRFKITNKYEENVHIAHVRSSCGCTIPRIEKSDLKTYEEGAIACEFNTRSFIGAKAAVVTVVFDKPFYGEMQLMVKGNIRSDIVTEPGEIQFGEIQRGTEKLTSVQITYAGKNRWEITDVRSANQNLGVKLEPITSSSGRVEYSMQVRLKDTAPAGDFSDQIVLVTNDENYNLVTVPVRGNIVTPLVMPVSIELGTVQLGSSVQQRMIIKSNSPFEVTKVECIDKRFSFETPEGKKTAHIIPIRFNSEGDVSGAFKETVQVYTSLPEDGIATTMISGNVVQ